jgi:predicted transporter
MLDALTIWLSHSQRRRILVIAAGYIALALAVVALYAAILSGGMP